MYCIIPVHHHNMEASVSFNTNFFCFEKLLLTWISIYEPIIMFMLFALCIIKTRKIFIYFPVFLTCIILALIKTIHSHEYPSTTVLKTLKKALKSVVLAFFCDFSVENLSRTEVVKYITFAWSYSKFYWDHIPMKNCKLDMRWWFLSQQIFWILAPFHGLFK